MEKCFTKKDLEEAYKHAWKADKTVYDGKKSFNNWFKNISKDAKKHI